MEIHDHQFKIRFYLKRFLLTKRVQVTSSKRELDFSNLIKFTRYSVTHQFHKNHKLLGMGKKPKFTHSELSQSLYEIISDNGQGLNHQAISTLESLTPTALNFSDELNNPSSQVALLNLLAELTAALNPKNAQPVFAKFCTIVETNYGTDSLATSDCYSTLAAYFTSQRKLKLALDFCGRALQNRTNNLGPTHNCTGDAHHNLGLVYRLMGNYELALTQFTSALQIRLEIDGEDSDRVAQIELAIGKLKEMENNFTPAVSRERSETPPPRNTKTNSPLFRSFVLFFALLLAHSLARSLARSIVSVSALQQCAQNI